MEPATRVARVSRTATTVTEQAAERRLPLDCMRDLPDLPPRGNSIGNARFAPIPARAALSVSIGLRAISCGNSDGSRQTRASSRRLARRQRQVVRPSRTERSERSLQLAPRTAMAFTELTSRPKAS